MRFGIVEFLMLVGSLGLFIYGMKVMSEGLQKVAGGRMQDALKAMTRNRFLGVFTGFSATAIVQSSSATTVMVVSFVNAGLLNLRQAISTIMGANIGTTVKMVLISASVAAEFRIADLSVPIIGLAFPLLFMRNARAKAFSEFLIGFGLLFLGLDYLKFAVPPPSPEALAFLGGMGDMGLLSVVLFVIIGIFLTVVVQSSSAAMALTLVLCEKGTIGYDMAAAIVLGENIGTTITANIASLVGNVWAKRAARSHLVFNVFGVAWMLLLFHPVLGLLDGIVTRTTGASPYDDPAAVKWALTYLHIGFNLANTLLFIGFIPFLVKVVTWMVPSREKADEEFRLEYIDTDIPLSPEVSLLEARKEIAKFGRITHKMLGYLRNLLVQTDAGQRNMLLDKLKKYEEITDRIEVEVGAYLTKTATEARNEEVSARIRGLLAIIGDLERVGDIFFQMSKQLERKMADRLWFSPEQRENLLGMMDVLDEAFAVMLRNLDGDAEKLSLDAAVEVEQRINRRRDKLRRAHLKSVETGSYNVKSGLIYSDLFSSCEKVGDHLINVSEALAGEI